MICWRAAAGPELTIGNALGDGTAATLLPIAFKSDVPIAALQFDVLFDELQLGSEPALISVMATNQVVVSSEFSPGTLRIVIYSPRNAPLPNGNILALPFTPLPGLTEGVFSLTPTNAIAADASAKSVAPVKLTAGSFTVVAVAAGARFTTVSVSATGQIDLQLTGAAGRAFALQSSLDLRQWTSIATNTIPATGVLQFHDAAPGANARFYRAVQQ
ncbi:MAG: hypothetical protein HY043_15780 [Verrucomicrobia bacterium]|nr:hypothetical protein [Verrucomicrobiota bacterium]